MIYYLIQLIQDQAQGTAWAESVSWLRVFRYITIRAACAAVTALGLSWWLGPHLIAWLRNIKLKQEYRDKAEEGGVARGAMRTEGGGRRSGRERWRAKALCFPSSLASCVLQSCVFIRPLSSAQRLLRWIPM